MNLLRWLRGLFAPKDKSVAVAQAEEPSNRSVTINGEFIRRVAAKEPGAEDECFRLYKPLPGVLPPGMEVAMDEGVSASYDFIATSNGYTEGLAFLGFQYLAELTQRPEYRRASEIIADEMTRKWIKLTYSGNGDASDKLMKLEAAMRKFKLSKRFRRGIELDGEFGRGHLYVDFGARAALKGLDKPLVISPATIKKGSLKGFKPIEPMWMYPDKYNSTNPLQPYYFEPETWWVQGDRVHSSRMLTLISKPMPDILKPAYAFAGLSLSQMMKPYVDNWIQTRQAVSDLIHSFSTSGLKTTMDAWIQAGDAAAVRGRAELFNATRDNRGLMLIDKDTEDFFNVSTPLSELSELQAQAQEHMSAVVAIPLVKYLGITPSGLNASADGEIRVFYDWIMSEQERLLTDPITICLQIIQLNEFGEIDDGIGFKFVPLWQLDEGEQAVADKTKGETATAYINAGVIDAEEERERLAHDEDGTYSGLNLSKTITPPLDLTQPPQGDGDPKDPQGDDGGGKDTGTSADA